VTAGVLAMLLVTGAYFALDYWASAEARAQAALSLGIDKMTPGHYDEAVRDFDRAIAISPQWAAGYLNRGLARRQLGRFDEALADLERAVMLDPSLTAAYNERGRIFVERGETGRAAEELSRSLAIAPTANGYYQRGQLWQSLRQYEKALADFNLAIREMTDAPYVYDARAAAKRALGDVDGAHADQEASLRLQNAVLPKP
jgi:tetratricopeptide (TPR) repeat protein